MLPDDVLGNGGQLDLGKIGLARQRVEVHSELLGQRLGDLILLAEPGLDEGLSQSLARAGGDGNALFDLLLGDDAVTDQDLAELQSLLAWAFGHVS